MGTTNLFIIIGHLGSEPVMSTTKNGKRVARMSVCTDKANKVGDSWETTAQWNTVFVWGKLAEYAEQRYKKGTTISAQCSVETKKVESNGGDAKYVTYITAYKCDGLNNMIENQKQADTGKHSQPDDDYDLIPF